MNKLIARSMNEKFKSEVAEVSYYNYSMPVVMFWILQNHDKGIKLWMDYGLEVV